MCVRGFFLTAVTLMGYGAQLLLLHVFTYLAYSTSVNICYIITHPLGILEKLLWYVLFSIIHISELIRNSNLLFL
jgi:hypothetical protein